ncbi:MAG: xanthine dehydrogenase family protein molybdopterin-binding subunit [Clostridium beijerinckii]|jgi:CO/xanthine dehydrogenase Mo-binding subunit|uniref:xanthine dehydrogenase family protein molybdopterin-binding subunit n=1 Tax=Clostridium beijerinckii TaxID=1520 RepID=UPI0024315CC7|nr:xanthine dehydrogenase family protein molybdopterin-binding subunit [Clostridium beijerinckii]MCI1478378.1 xanthine dehydrogenase family protein molybdopterin-binding subunit [Clostridium beijerinckii]MCI1579073.1 xanthine dehydrogenase family protein molybdopterin-binding subunit [Clostridium beijerinckii]MCI1582860.1 xanthine dehydrogenase family protein molybdopterin-binding subunit [Clostridium beijerinckii]MCI1623880.1 xanthine dehydrogenase family protein molybdopterin-binding subunit 
MDSIRKSVIKADHKIKVDGSAKYIADIKFKNSLYAKTLRSEKSKAVIKRIFIPELKDGYYVVEGKDVPGLNKVKIIQNDMPVFSDKEVNYIGEPILLVLGPDLEEVISILNDIKVEYEEGTPVFDMRNSTEIFDKYEYEKGNIEDAIKKSIKVIEEEFYTGYQEQAYLETQGLVGDYEDDKISVYGTMQCPYYVKGAVVQALGFEEDKVRIVQTTTGGGFGGKEDYPSLLGAQVAVAAYKAKKPVRLILDRVEDMAFTTKRHPALLKYKTLLDENNKIIGMDVDIILNGGAYATVSSVVLQRALLCAIGVYNIPNIRVKGRVVKTNTVPTGAFRGFGGPQSIFGIETHMAHIAKELGFTPLELKNKYFVKTGDDTCTGGKFTYDVKLEEMLEKAEKISDFSRKYKKYSSEQGIMRKGIGMSIFLHGCGFTGSGERDFIKAKVKLLKYESGVIEILVSNTDMGQGLQTTFKKIVAKALDKNYQDIIYENPDTDRVPDSGPTVASRSIMVVGKLLERAALRLKENWVDGKEQIIEENYKHPDLIPWNITKFNGDAYPSYSWGINVVEVEINTVTAVTEVTGIYTVFDIGIPIDETIMEGQIQGGVIQGLGYGSCENMEYDKVGKVRQHSITDYIIPTAKDVVNIKNELVDNPCDLGPFGAKGAGELTLVGTAPAYANAIENALGVKVNRLPVTPEWIMEAIVNE